MPWKSFGSANPSGEYVALLSALPLKSYWRTAAFFRFTFAIMSQLNGAKGVVGYSLLAHPFSKRYWTLSAWESDQALREFVSHPPHVKAMTAIAPHMSKTTFIRWKVKGSELPLRWDEALKRLAQ